MRKFVQYYYVANCQNSEFLCQNSFHETWKEKAGLTRLINLTILIIN